jgi:hypothetical protein
VTDYLPPIAVSADGEIIRLGIGVTLEGRGADRYRVVAINEPDEHGPSVDVVILNDRAAVIVPERIYLPYVYVSGGPWIRS